MSGIVKKLTKMTKKMTKLTIHTLDPLIVMRGTERVCVADTERDAELTVNAINTLCYNAVLNKLLKMIDDFPFERSPTLLQSHQMDKIRELIEDSL